MRRAPAVNSLQSQRCEMRMAEDDNEQLNARLNRLEGDVSPLS